MKIVLCTVAGFALGYYVAKKQLENTYIQLANDEANKADEYYSAKWAEKVTEEKPTADISGLGELPKPDEEEFLLQEATTALTSYQTGETPKQVIETPELMIITDDEFLENPHDYEQMTFTYYQGDKVLVGDKDVRIPSADADKYVGLVNLEKIGDDDAMYIRNVTLDTEFEIIRSAGHYSIEVLGLDTVTGDRE